MEHVKTEHDEAEEFCSIYVKSEYTEENSATEPTDESISLVTDSLEIEMRNPDPSEDNSIAEHVVKSQFDDAELKQEVSSVDFSSEYTHENTVTQPTREPESPVIDLTPSSINQNTDSSEDCNIRQITNVDTGIDTEVTCQRISEALTEITIGKEHFMHTEKQSPPSEFRQNMSFERNQLKTRKGVKCSRNLYMNSFSQKGHLERDMVTRNKEKPFSCDLCAKEFTVKSTLKRHMLTHTGQKPFSCNVCTKAFNRSGNLKKHMLIHTGEKPFSCHVCSRAFTQSSILKTHMVTHTGEKSFSCNICTKAFTQSSNLKKHMVTHTGEKRFSCVVCAKTFTQSSSLNLHMATHTEGKSFLCEICAKAFTQRGKLKAHMTIHTEEIP